VTSYLEVKRVYNMSQLMFSGVESMCYDAISHKRREEHPKNKFQVQKKTKNHVKILPHGQGTSDLVHGRGILTYPDGGRCVRCGC
jgi:hypothetical protein